MYTSINSLWIGLVSLRGGSFNFTFFIDFFFTFFAFYLYTHSYVYTVIMGTLSYNNNIFSIDCNCNIILISFLPFTIGLI